MNVSSQIVYEERNSNVGLGETIRFRIPANLLLLNSQETYLKFNVVVGSEPGAQTLALGEQADVNHWFPWSFGEGGCANLVHSLTVKTQDGVILEQITDYNRLNRMFSNYVENSSQKNLKRLYEGSDTNEIKAVNTLTRRGIDDQGASTPLKSQENMEVECVLPLRLSGILNNQQPYPNFLAPLEVEILLESEVYNVIHAQGQQGSEAPNFLSDKDVQAKSAGYRTDTMPYKVDGTPNSATQTTLTILDVNNGNDNVYTGEVTAGTTPNFPFFTGQEITIGGSTAINAVINSISVAANKLVLTIPSTDFSGNSVANPKVWVKVPTSEPSMTLSELQLVCGTVNPSSKQMSAIESAVRSGQGYGWAYKSYQDFPVNLSNNALQTSSLINCRYRMCKSILSFYENVGNVKLVEVDNLVPEIGANVALSTYQYKLGGLNVPNRAVDVSRYVRNRTQPGAWNANHIKELEQAVANCDYMVKDLSNADQCLLFGRGLVPPNSGFFYDMSDNEETRLNLKFSSQSQSLLLHNYVCHLKTLVIKADQKMVVE